MQHVCSLLWHKSPVICNVQVILDRPFWSRCGFLLENYAYRYAFQRFQSCVLQKQMFWDYTVTLCWWEWRVTYQYPISRNVVSCSARDMGVPGRLIIWHPLNPTFEDRAGEHFWGRVFKLRIIFWEIISRVTWVYWHHISDYSSDVLVPLRCWRPGKLRGRPAPDRPSVIQFAVGPQ